MSWDLDMARRGDPGPRGGRLLETHRQTSHKLELMLRYWEVWSRIVARARGYPFCVDSLWLIDCFAGRGLHPSNAHPDGFIPGTPVQAFRAATATHRAVRSSRFHLRAVERNGRVAQELERRLVRLSGAAADKPEWRVLPTAFATAAPEIIAEMAADRGHGHSSGSAYRQHDHRSLWFIDPDGLKDIPHTAVDPLQPLTGAEVIINLDLGGMWRVARTAELALAAGDVRAVAKAINEQVMHRTFGGDVWRDVIDRADQHDIFGSIAQGYADTFPAFPYRCVYPLHSSRTQRRYLVHLTHSPRARDAFAEEYLASWKIGTVLSDEGLSTPQRATRALRLFDQFRGTEVTVQEMYDLGVGASRRQITSVCRAAEEMRLGDFDDAASRMTWYEDRVPEQGLGL